MTKMTTFWRYTRNSHLSTRYFGRQYLWMYRNNCSSTLPLLLAYYRPLCSITYCKLPHFAGLGGNIQHHGAVTWLHNTGSCNPHLNVKHKNIALPRKIPLCELCYKEQSINIIVKVLSSSRKGDMNTIWLLMICRWKRIQQPCLHTNYEKSFIISRNWALTISYSPEYRIPDLPWINSETLPAIISKWCCRCSIFKWSANSLKFKIETSPSRPSR